MTLSYRPTPESSSTRTVINVIFAINEVLGDCVYRFAPIGNL